MSTIREGSTLYYSLLWTSPAARQRFVERLELVQALSSTLEGVHEPQVAERKIHWWHEELQRMVEGTARHPAAQACQSCLSVTDIPPWATLQSKEAGVASVTDNPVLNACLNIVSAASTTRFDPPATEADANALLEQSYLARLALLAHALSDDVDDLNLQLHSRIAARALGKHEQLSRLPQLIHRGQAVFSDARYKKHAIRPSDLAERIRIASEPGSESSSEAYNGSQSVGSGLGNTTPLTTSRLGAIPDSIEKPGCQDLLNAVIADTHADFIEALADGETRACYRQTPLQPLWRLIALREKQLALWQRNSPDLLRERSTLTPLKKLFHAWRNR